MYYHAATDIAITTAAATASNKSNHLSTLITTFFKFKHILSLAILQKKYHSYLCDFCLNCQLVLFGIMCYDIILSSLSLINNFEFH